MNNLKSLSRNYMANCLVQDIQSWPFSIACWEGGSAANKRVDPYSDLDLVIAVENGNVEEAFSRIQTYINSIAEIDHLWRVPEPTWHGHSQTFYKLSHCPEYFFLDVVVMQEKAQQRFLERERHGNPVIHFDKKNFIQISSCDTEEFRTKRRQRLETIEASFSFFKAIALKEMLRNRPLDAMAFYRNLINILVELLGMKYRPFRYDFGLRYLHNDLPIDEQRELEGFCYVSDLKQIEEYIPAIELRVLKLVAELTS